MVHAVSTSVGITVTPALTPLTRPPRDVTTAAPVASPKDCFVGSTGPAPKAKVQGVWASTVVGDSQRSYLLNVPKDLPASFTFDETKMDAADRQEMAKEPKLRPMFAKLQYLETTDPQARKAFQDLLGSLRNGDVMLRTYGSTTTTTSFYGKLGVSDPKGPGTLNSVAIASTGGAYSHVAMVQRPNAATRPQVTEAIFEGGVTESGLYTFLSALVDPVMGDRTAVTLMRPTENPIEANAAAAFAKDQVGSKYNFAMRPNRAPGDGKTNGWYCSQLVYESFDMNPAIRHAVFNVQQKPEDATRSRLTNAVVQGLRGEKALDAFFTNKHGTELKPRLCGVAKDLGKTWLHDGPSAIIRDGMRSVVMIGQISAASVNGKLGVSPQTHVRGGTVPAYVTPGDLAANDGRKVMTIMLNLTK